MQEVSFIKPYAKQKCIYGHNQRIIRNSFLWWNGDMNNEPWGSQMETCHMSQVDFEPYLAAVLWDTPTFSHHLVITPTPKILLTELQHKKIKGSIHKAQTPSVTTGKQKTPLFTRSFALTFHWATVRNYVFHSELSKFQLLPISINLV